MKVDPLHPNVSDSLDAIVYWKAQLLHSVLENGLPFCQLRWITEKSFPFTIMFADMVQEIGYGLRNVGAVGRDAKGCQAADIGDDLCSNVLDGHFLWGAGPQQELSAHNVTHYRIGPFSIGQEGSLVIGFRLNVQQGRKAAHQMMNESGVLTIETILSYHVGEESRLQWERTNEKAILVWWDVYICQAAIFSLDGR